MPVKYVVGDLFDAPTQTIVNTVNTRGVMSKGLALSFKERFPEMFQDYRKRCTNGEVCVGEPYLFTGSHPWILNFPTKDHWRYPSRLEWVRAGLEYFTRHYGEWGITSVAFPQLGTLNGRLSWNAVRLIMHEVLDPLDITVLIYTQGPEATANELQAAVDLGRDRQPRLL